MAYSIVDKSTTRIDAEDKVRSKAKYVSDIRLPHKLRGRILRSTLPHAKVLNVDESRAEKLRGVAAVITVGDMPHSRIGFALRDQLRGDVILSSD